MLVTQQKDHPQKSTRREEAEEVVNRVNENISNIDLEESAPGTQREEELVVEHIDWDKVGKIYKPESAVEHIASKEMMRL